jgi:hypothetical protein
MIYDYYDGIVDNFGTSWTSNSTTYNDDLYVDVAWPARGL